MRAGLLRKQVVIQQPSATQNTRGEEIPSWATFLTVRAAIEPLNGRELLAAQSIESQVTTKITIRYQSGITPDMRIKYGSRYFDIQAIQNIEERNRMIEMQCIERVGES